MKQKQKHKRNKRIVRSALTGKVINGSEVIKVNEVVEYAKKLGYTVISPRLVASIHIFTTIFLVLGALILFMPFTSAAEGIFKADFDLVSNQLGIILLFVIAGFMAIKKKYLFTSILTILGGFILLVSEVNLVISLVVIFVGIYFAFKEEGET